MTIYLKELSNDQLSTLMEWADHYESTRPLTEEIYSELLLRHSYIPAIGDCGEAPCPIPVEGFKNKPTQYKRRNPGDGQP